MKIHNKLFTTLFIFSLVLVVSFVALMQWSIDRGMIEYVNKREVKTLAPLISQLISRYQQDNNWQALQNNHQTFQKMLQSTLAGSEFAPPANFNDPNRPPTGDRRGRRPPPRRNGDFSHPPRDHNRQQLKPSPRPNDGINSFNENRATDDGVYRGSPEENHIKPDDRRPPPPREYQVSYALLDSDKVYIVGDYPAERDYIYSSLTVNEQVVGYLAVSKRNRLTAGYELDFIEQQTQYLWVIALAVMFLVILVTMPLAKHLLAPIRELTKGMHQLTQGNYQSKLVMKRTDEFAELSRDYNELAKTLLENESARKRWLANISHELRTPVAILKGELEAIIDGVRVLSLEQIHSANQEVLHLERLIADLHALTSADIGGMSYRKNDINIVEFIETETRKYQSYLSDAGFQFEACYQDEELVIFADETRLCQLFENLINNCIKYANDGDVVKLTARQSKQLDSVELIIEDNGNGVDSRHLSHLFEHLYRVDDSRNRQTGGTGLGLSICAHIVEAHQGKINAEKSLLGGLAIRITLPLI